MSNSRIIYFLLSLMLPPHTVNPEHRDRLQSTLWNSMSPPAGLGSDPAQESRLAPRKPSRPLKNEVISYWLIQHQQIKIIYSSLECIILTEGGFIFSLVFFLVSDLYNFFYIFLIFIGTKKITWCFEKGSDYSITVKITKKYVQGVLHNL